MFLHLEMVVPEVDKKLLEELEGMGFSTARATRALHYSGELMKKKIVYLLNDIEASYIWLAFSGFVYVLPHLLFPSEK